MSNVKEKNKGMISNVDSNMNLDENIKKIDNNMKPEKIKDVFKANSDNKNNNNYFDSYPQGKENIQHNNNSYN